MKGNVLIVDDSLTVRMDLADAFETVGLRPLLCSTIREARETFTVETIDLVILDVMLPDGDGVEFLKEIRTRLATPDLPILMLSGEAEVKDRIRGLQTGADDYVAKPFRFAVLLARIRAQLRQHEASEDAVFTIGPYSFQPSSKLLMGGKGNKVRLTEKETAILRFLYRAGQRSISREVLLQEVWGYNSGVTTHTLETHIYRLRQKIEKDAAMPEILVTEAGGYKLVP